MHGPAPRITGGLVVVVLLGTLFGLVVAACGDSRTAIAELTKTAGPVERQAGSGDEIPWKGATTGTKFYLFDAARTADGAAELEITGGAKIAMQPRTVLRFGGSGKASKILVEAGAIDLTGTGSYATDVGDVRLSRNGTVRITAKGAGKASILLTIGEAQVSTIDGETITLVVGEIIDLDLTVAEVTSVIDAGVAQVVPDAGLDAGLDAGVVVADAATIEVTGKRAEVLRPGEAKWAPLPAGAGVIEKGSKVRLGGRTTAKLDAGGTTLELGGGSRVALDDQLAFALELGEARALTTTDASIALPGGAIAVRGTPQGASQARLVVNRRETKITMTRGGAKLTGTGGSELAMSRGESATLAKSGLIRVIEAIPRYFDFRVAVGDTFTIHDPRPPTAVQFQFGGKCPEGGIIEMDKNMRFRAAKVSSGKENANLLVERGGWTYRLRCTSGAGEGQAVASGRIVVMRDGGRRRLPKSPPLNRMDLDGRNYRFDYQSVIPNLQVKFPGGGSTFRLHLAQGGDEVTFDSRKPMLIIPGKKLEEGTYTYWFDRDGVKQPKVATLTIGFDQTAAQVYIQAPLNGKPWSGDIDVKGAALPGWSAAINDVPVPIDDRTRRFDVKAARPPGKALAIKLSHPRRGVHYYLRRAK